MISELFQSQKGRMVNSRRTICEVHRELFDVAVKEVSCSPSLLKRFITLLEEAFIMAIKMDARLIENKLSPYCDSGVDNFEQNKVERAERDRLLAILESDQAFLEAYV